MSSPEQYRDEIVRPEQLNVGRLVVRVRESGGWLFARWRRVLLISFCFAVLCCSYFYFKKPTYSAEVSFALDEQSAVAVRNDFSDLPAGLGLRPVAEPGGTVFSTLNNVAELIRSRLLIDKTLKSSVLVNGKQLLLADFFLDSLDYRDSWTTDARYQHVNFARDSADPQRTLYVNTLLGRMYELLIKKILTIEKKGKGTSIIAVTCTSENESFSKYFIESLIGNTEQYYTETRTQRAKLNLDFITKRTDSVRAVYNAALFGRAVFTDANVNPGRQVAVVQGEKQQTDIAIMKSAYTELARSLELAKAALSRDTPLFQYLDMPVFPLKRNAPPLLIYFFVFFIAGIVITCGFLLFGKWLEAVSRQPQFDHSTVNLS